MRLPGRKTLVVAGALAAVGVTVTLAKMLRDLARENAARHHNNLGVALLDEAIANGSLFPEALKEFEAALRLAPDSSEARTNLGIAQYCAGQLADRIWLGLARTTLEVVIASEPRNLRARYTLALIELDREALSPAEKHLRMVLEEDPKDFHALLKLGTCLSQTGRLEEAIAMFQKAIAESPHLAAPHYHLQAALRELGKTEEASVALKDFKSLEKNSPRSMDQSGQRLVKIDRYLQPAGDSRSALPRPDRKARYADVTRKVGLDFVHGARPRSRQPEMVLRGEPTPREWFADVENRRDLMAAVSTGCAFLDYQNDGRLDLFLANVDGRHALYAQTSDGRFEDVTAKVGLPAAPALGTACASGDFDNDGLPDLFLAGYGGARLYHNTGSGLKDVTGEAGLASLVPATSWCASAAFADVDHDGDLDIYVGRLVELARVPEKAQLRFPDDFEPQLDLLLRNNRDGTFTEVSKEAFPQGGASRTRGALFSDLDEDQAIDLVAFDLAGKPRVFFNRKDLSFAPPQETAPGLDALPGLPPLGEAQAFGDYNGDGAPDLLVNKSGAPAVLLENRTLPPNWLTVRLEGFTQPGRVKSNRQGVGSRVEVRSVGLWGKKELRAGNGLGGSDAAEVYFDLGDETRLDYVRVRFPSGGRASARDVKPNQVITIKEPDLEVNSCPAVFTWNGERFEFIADTLSAGILGELTAPGEYWRPDPDEWLRIRGDQLRPRDGALELRFANHLEEVTYADRFRLLAVDHPAGVEVYPGERMLSEPRNRAPATVYALTNFRPVARATDHREADATRTLAAADRSHYEGFALKPFKGFAEDWSLTLDLGAASAPRTVLLLHGWTRWNSSASAFAAAQAKLVLRGPSLDVQGADGAWRPAIEDLGVAAGLPRTVLADLSAVLRAGERIVRIRTNRMLYLDQALVADVVQAFDPASGRPAAPLAATELPLKGGELRWLGYPKRVLPEGRAPEVFDYHALEPEASWSTHSGFLTRRGDVTPLLREIDDRFVVMSHGEEIALSFEAAKLPARRDGFHRTFLLLAHGYEKGFEIHAAHARTVEPLPYHSMGSYPPPPGRFIADEARLKYLFEWNTRPGFLEPTR